MRILKSLCISFSLYSKIPVPQFAWEEDDMKYVLCFFPWIGVVTGALLLLWSYICKRLSIGNLAFTCIGTALPLSPADFMRMDLWTRWMRFIPIKSGKKN